MADNELPPTSRDLINTHLMDRPEMSAKVLTELVKEEGSTARHKHDEEQKTRRVEIETPGYQIARVLWPLVPVLALVCLLVFLLQRAGLIGRLTAGSG
jgi:hypothetical protein